MNRYSYLSNKEIDDLIEQHKTEAWHEGYQTCVEEKELFDTIDFNPPEEFE